MNLPSTLSKTGVAARKQAQIPQGKKTGIISAIVDTREPEHIQALTFGGVPTVTTALDAGDVMCACEDNSIILVERKTPSDLLGTIKSGRLFPQCERMIQVTPWSYIVITGLIYRDRDGMVTVGGRGHTGWTYSSVQGALLTCQEMGVGVVTCGSDSEFEATVIRLCKRDRSTVRIKPPRETYLLRDGEAALAALPGIGPERIKALVGELGGVASVLEWLTNLEDQRQVPGVADGIKQGVKAALGLNGEVIRILPWTAQQSSYTPNGGFIAAADEAALEFLKEATSNGK